MTTTISASPCPDSPMSTDIGTEILRAKKTAYNILAYADNTETALRRKLAQRGFSGEAIDAAVEKMRESGALDERRMLRSRQIYLVETKKYGRRRAELELRRMGFSREYIEGADWSEFDFVGICTQLLRRAGELDRRVYASLLRRGFSPSEIKAAEKIIEEEHR